MEPVSRYRAHKLTGITESVFSKMWTRHCAAEQLYHFFTDDGKINIEDPTFQEKYYSRIIPEEMEKLIEKNKPKPKKIPKKKIPKIKTEKKKTVPKKSVTKKTISEKKEIIKNEKEKLKKPKKSVVGNLTEQKLKKENIKLDEQIKQLRIKNNHARGLLIEKESLGDTVYGYINALNHNIMSMPKGIIDEFESGLKTGMTRAELINILTEPICEAIKDTKDGIKKEIAKSRVKHEEIDNDL